MPLGDSNTRGHSRNPARRDVGGYRTRLWHRLNTLAQTTGTFEVSFVGRRKDGPKNIAPHHEGWGGFSIDQLISDPSKTVRHGVQYTTIEAALLASYPNLVLLMAGTNSLIKGDPVAIALKELGELVDRIAATLTGTQIFVASLLPNYSSLLRQVRTEEFSTRVLDAVITPRKPLPNGNQLEFINIFNLSLERLEYTEFDLDGYHLTPRGYDKIADIWYEAIVLKLITNEFPHKIVSNESLKRPVPTKDQWSSR